MTSQLKPSEVLDQAAELIEVPLEAFALLFAYCHIGQLDVPEAVRRHPAYPGQPRLDGRKGHLTAALRPYAEKAFAALKDAAQLARSEGE